jgi:nucleoside-diphosphate-sugar epimerase
MRIAVTGGNGRIGRAVTALALAQGHTVTSLDRASSDEAVPGVAFKETDVSDYDATAQAIDGSDAVVHLAAIPGPNRHPDHQVHNNNVVGSYNVLHAAAALGIRRFCMASSINATGAIFSRCPRYDYFPLDERHATYNEDPYSLSKWIGEQQGDSFARRYTDMTIASLRFHMVVPSRSDAVQRGSDRDETMAKQLWGYTTFDAAARACLQSLQAGFDGHEAFYIVAPDTMSDRSTEELIEQFYPAVPLHRTLSGSQGFYDCAKAERLLGWRHDE